MLRYLLIFGYYFSSVAADHEQWQHRRRRQQESDGDVGCSVCGYGKEVTIPNAIFSYPGQPSVSCGILEGAGKYGQIPLYQCSFLPSLAEMEVCGCAVPTTTNPTANPTKAPPITTPPTQIPTSEPTLTPTSPAPTTIQPTLAPTVKPTAIQTFEPTSTPVKPTSAPTPAPIASAPEQQSTPTTMLESTSMIPDEEDVPPLAPIYSLRAAKTSSGNTIFHRQSEIMKTIFVVVTATVTIFHSF